ncbi:hypothetical protein QZR14_22445 [Pseudomonas sp. rhizo66]|uniref:hypothetical protein n=1 Tax=Pseudomonas sp. rhizo66 TaxID=3059674 RepID=UPI00288FD988|nr:hypothetical protein [Pseudomonas sp. rhizo66]MDT3314131.1 hypothetical protein [Pseudomonas sp. rhizo66]
MSMKFDYFYRGITRAERRRAMQQQAKHYTQTTQQIDTSVVSATTAKQSDKKLNDQVYKESLLSKMRERLAQIKADDKNKPTNHKE